MATTKLEKVQTPEIDKGWDDMMEITLPRPHGGAAKSVYVAMNGRSFQVPLGKKCEVPYPIYERLMISMDAEEAAQDIFEAVPDKQ